MDKSEQTDITPEEFELDDCLLESNDIVITQNKDGFVLHVKKLGNITTAKLAPHSTQDQQQLLDQQQIEQQQLGPSTAVAIPADCSGSVHTIQSHQIVDIQDMPDVKPTFTTLTTSQAIKLPSSECGKYYLCLDPIDDLYFYILYCRVMPKVP